MSIYTKMHEALASPCTLPGQSDELAALKSFGDVPHIVLQKEMFHQLEWDAVIKSLGAVMQVGRFRLPYPLFMMELYAGDPHFRYFVALEEHEYPKVAFRVFEYVNGELWPNKLSGLMEFGALDHALTSDEKKLNEEMFGADRVADIEEMFVPGEIGFKVSADDTYRKDIIPHVARGIILATMLTNINGVERETIEPTALNKARARNGKTAIPTHSVVSIGHVYDRQGRRVKYDASGRKVRVHMRAAHVRWQHHGALWASGHREEIGVKQGVEESRHLILVEAVLVNYRDGTDLATPLPKLVKY